MAEKKAGRERVLGWLGVSRVSRLQSRAVETSFFIAATGGLSLVIRHWRLAAPAAKSPRETELRGQGVNGRIETFRAGLGKLGEVRAVSLVSAEKGWF